MEGCKMKVGNEQAAERKITMKNNPAAERKIMTGNAAIARGAYEAGVRVSAAYPGSPSTEISENIINYPEIYSEWSTNEKVACEVAFGASMSGVRSLCSMKHVGLNVASDPLFTAVYSGINGGMVLVVADDPGVYSSQNAQDTRMVARAAMVPAIEASDSEEAREYIKFAYELSEKYDTPVVFRTTTGLSHSHSPVTLDSPKPVMVKPYVRNEFKNVMMPKSVRKRHKMVEERMKKIAVDGAQMPINRIEAGDSSIGFITAGIPYQYVKEVCPDASVLKLGLVNPIPKALVKEFAEMVDKLYIFEELEPVIEEQVRAMGIPCIGKEVFSAQGEYSSNMLKRVLYGYEPREEAAVVPERSPVLCPGCPHRSVYTALKTLGLQAIGDIGCYTLGAVAPLNVVDSTNCMGASISMFHGMEKARGKEFIKDYVAVIGDSTFLHTGINSLLNMMYNKATGTVLILDNSTTGMTGHQDNAATGKTLRGEPTDIINIHKLCKAIGIDNVEEVDSYNQAELTKVIKREVAKEAVSVVICKGPCALLPGLKFPYICKPIPENCKRCGACLKPGCPALTRNDDGTISIDGIMCTGCSLCKQMCRFGAIEMSERQG